MNRDLSAFPALALLQSQLGSGLVEAVVEAFRQDTPDTLRELAAGAEAGRTDKVELYAHAIAGSAAEIGLEDLAEAARQLERTAHTNPAQIADHLTVVLGLVVAGLDSLGRAFAES